MLRPAYVGTLVPFALFHVCMVLCNGTTKGFVTRRKRRGQQRWEYRGDFVTDHIEGLREICCVPFRLRAATEAEVRRARIQPRSAVSIAMRRLSHNDGVAIACLWHLLPRHGLAARWFYNLTDLPQVLRGMNDAQPLRE